MHITIYDSNIGSNKQNTAEAQCMDEDELPKILSKENSSQKILAPKLPHPRPVRKMNMCMHFPRQKNSGMKLQLKKEVLRPLKLSQHKSSIRRGGARVNCTK